MHKIRNTKHIEILNSMANTTYKGCLQPLSKRKLRELLRIYKWDKKKVIQCIESGDYVYHFITD